MLFGLDYLLVVILGMFFIGVSVSIKPYFLAMVMLLIAFITFLLFVVKSSLWISLMFFLIYIGGVLMLFFYVFSMMPKSGVTKFYIYVMAGMFFVNSLLMVGFLGYSGSFKESEALMEYSGYLFNSVDLFLLVLVGCFLLFMLWVMSKLTINSSGSVRDFS